MISRLGRDGWLAEIAAVADGATRLANAAPARRGLSEAPVDANNFVSTESKQGLVSAI